MIIYLNNNLLESPAKVLVNTVNTVGVMGKGIALTFRKIYPEMFRRYQRICENKKLHTGSLWLYKTPHKWILNFPTKKHWRQPSQVEYIEEGLKKFTKTYSDMGITSIAFPQLGCGNGELAWETTVQPLMINYLSKLPIDIFIYIYPERPLVPEHKDIQAMSSWLRREPSMLAFEEMWHDLTKVIGNGLDLSMWGSEDNFRVVFHNQPERGLFLQKIPKNIRQRLGHIIQKLATMFRISKEEDIFIPEDAILDLWQIVREYGFCVPRIMPLGLDILAPCILPLLAQLDYMRKVTLTRRMKNGTLEKEYGLQLLPLNAISKRNNKQKAHTVQHA